jgi:CheY-like chemotaxis protein
MSSNLSGKYRILLIEDDPQIANIALTSLTKAGLECRHTANGIQGLIEFKRFEPHLVLTDLMLPGVDGRTICGEIRNVSLAPIIMMTSADASDAEAQAFEAGADDYIAKPFDPRLLVLRVGAHLRRVYHYDMQAAQNAESDGSAADGIIAQTAPTVGSMGGTMAGLATTSSEDRPQPGWARCDSCRYMGPAKVFRKANAYGQRYVVCPHCQDMDNICFG